MSTDIVADGLVVGIAYTLKVDGMEVDATDKDEPLEYLHGAQNIVPGLEAVLNGKKIGDQIAVSVPPEQAFGHYDPEEVDEVPRSELPEIDALQEGVLLEVMDEEGDTYLAYVREIKTDSVVLDFNPPFAGKTLDYDVTIVSIRNATPDEVAHGHVHSHDHHHNGHENGHDHDD